MVVDHVEDDADAGLMQGLHHLLELADAAGGVVGVGGVAALGYVVVERVVAPVVLRLIEARLVDRGVVERREDVDGVDAEALEVVDGPRFGEREELPRILRGDALVEHRWVVVDVAPDGEVADVHLVDDEVGRRLECGPAVALPPHRVGLGQVDDGAALTIDADGAGKDAGRLAGMALVAGDVEGVELSFPVALHGGCPAAGFGALHLHRLEWLATKAGAIEPQYRRLTLRRTAEEGERRGLGGVVDLGVIVHGHRGGVDGRWRNRTGLQGRERTGLCAGREKKEGHEGEKGRKLHGEESYRENRRRCTAAPYRTGAHHYDQSDRWLPPS